MVTSILPLPSTQVSGSQPTLADHGLWRDTSQNKTKAQIGTTIKPVVEMLIDGQPIKASYRDGVPLYLRKILSGGSGTYLDEGVLTGNHKAGATQKTLSHARAIHLEAGEEYTVWVSGKVWENQLPSRVIFDVWQLGTTTPPVVADPDSTAASLVTHTFIPPKTTSQVPGDFGTATAGEGFKFTVSSTGNYMVTFRLLGPLPNLTYAILAVAGTQMGLKTQYHREFAGSRTDPATSTTTEHVHVFHPGTFNSPVSHWTWEDKVVTTVSPDHGVPTGSPIPHSQWSAITQGTGVQFTAHGSTRVECAATVHLTSAGNIGIAALVYPRGTSINPNNIQDRAITVRSSHPNHMKGTIAQGSSSFAAGMNCVPDFIEFDYNGDVDLHIYVYVEGATALVAKADSPAFVMTAFGDPAVNNGPSPHMIKLWRSIPEMIPKHPGSAHLVYQDSNKAFGAPVTVKVIGSNGGSRLEHFTNPFDVTLTGTAAIPIVAVVIGTTQYNVDGTTASVAPILPQSEIDAFVSAFLAAASKAVVDATAWIRAGWDRDLSDRMAAMPHTTRAQCMAVYQVAYDHMTAAMNSGNAWASGRRNELIQKLQWMNMADPSIFPSSVAPLAQNIIDKGGAIPNIP